MDFPINDPTVQLIILIASTFLPLILKIAKFKEWVYSKGGRPWLSVALSVGLAIAVMVIKGLIAGFSSVGDWVAGIGIAVAWTQFCWNTIWKPLLDKYKPS